MIRKTAILLAALIFFMTGAAIAANYNYISPEEFKSALDANKPVIIVDIQVAEEYSRHHFNNSIETNAFPVKSDEERKRIDPAVAEYQKSGHDVVVVCPRGGGGAKRCYDYLKEQGVDESHLTILTGGIEKWPYGEMLSAR